MYAVIGEDKSDVETLNTIIRRIAGNPRLSVKRKGYNGCAEMLTKGANQLQAYSELGYNRFIICYDADRDRPDNRYRMIVDRIIKPSGVTGKFCALVPVQELEAWILADLKAVTNVIPSWRPTKVFNHPEQCNDPKEELVRLSRGEQHRPRYSNATHNEKIAAYLDLNEIKKKCPSFLPLINIITKDIGNYP